MNMAIVYIITLALYIRSISSKSNCSAINSYIQITSPSNLVETVTSSKSLFPPYSYYVQSTELVTLNTATDNICDPFAGGLTTNITNKIVLISVSHGLCSNHYKVYTAQQNNATAVIFIEHDASGEVFDIKNDWYLASVGLSTSIPVRAISYAHGTIISNAIASGTTVIAAFHCFDTLYPTQLCILDTLGDFWYLDGDYQRQEATKNDHPVYKKEGYVYLLSHLYIFLMRGDSDNTDWLWTITLDPDLSSETYIRARCAVGTISDPSLCPLWNTTNAFNSNKAVSFSAYSDLSVSSGLCSISDAYLCIESTQSDLRGLDGIYRQFNPNVAFWFRELDDCDTRPGWLLYQEPDFVLLDSLNVWAVAQCEAAQDTSDPTLCTEWRSITADTLIEELKLDETFTISACTPNTSSTSCNPSITAPDMLCMDKSSVMHGFLEGQYAETGVVGTTYGSAEYMRTEALFYDGEYIDVYVWWFGEINMDEHSWWVISKSSLTEAIQEAGNVNIYAYCESKTMSPSDCAASWNFYFISAFHPDTDFQLYDGLCSSAQASEEYEWPQYVCVGFRNESIGTQSVYLSAKLFVGGYEINATETTLGDGTPHWIKPKTESVSQDMYLYFDGFFAYWQIGNALNVEHGVVLFCYQEEDYSPVDCDIWYDAWLTKMDNMYLYECSESDMIRSSAKKSNTGVMIGVIVTFCVCCICIFGCFYKMNVKKGEVSFDHHEANKAIASKAVADFGSGSTKDTDKKNKVDFSPLDIDSPTNDTNREEEESTSAEKNEKQDADVVLEEEKKEKQGDKRRLSQEKVDTMKQSLDNWTTALIQDPKAAARRYSKTDPTEVKKIQKFYKTVMDPLFNKKVAAEKKRKRNQLYKELLKDPDKVKKLYHDIMDPLYDSKSRKNDDVEEEKEDVPLDDAEIQKLYERIMDPLISKKIVEDDDELVKDVDADKKALYKRLLEEPEKIKKWYKDLMERVNKPKKEERLDEDEIKKLYKAVMDPLYNFPLTDSEDNDENDVEDNEDDVKEEDEDKDRVQLEEEDNKGTKNRKDDANVDATTDDTPSGWTQF